MPRATRDVLKVGLNEARRCYVYAADDLEKFAEVHGEITRELLVHDRLTRADLEHLPLTGALLREYA